jgi:methylglutaconyl-CoA hydratase
MSELVLSDTDARGVTTLTLNRPEQRNALNGALIEALIEQLEALRVVVDTRVVVLTGAGDVFCAGADLQWMRDLADADEATNIAGARLIGDLMRALSTLPQATVARVQGSAFGGGLGIVAACDIAIAVGDAQMAFSEVRLGLSPATIGPVVVSAIGMRAARRLFLTAERIHALEAMRLGLVHEVVNLDGLDSAVARTVEMLLAAGPEALRASKRILTEIERGADPEALAAALACLRASDEGQEGLAAFFEKRRPSWQATPSNRNL